MNEIYTLYYQEGENVYCKKQNPDRLLYQDFFVPRAVVGYKYIFGAKQVIINTQRSKLKFNLSIFV